MEIKYPFPIIFDVTRVPCLNTSVTLVLKHCISFVMGRDSSVGIATRYELERTGMESRWKR